MQFCFRKCKNLTNKSSQLHNSERMCSINDDVEKKLKVSNY